VGYRISGVQHSVELDSERTVKPTGPAWAQAYPSLPYVLPFVVFLVLLAAHDYFAVIGPLEYPLRVAALAAVLWVCSRHVINFHVRTPVATIGIGVAVFVLWIAPDVLFPGYRNHWLFENSLTGQVRSSLPEELRANAMVLISRAARAAIIVPIIEELFWRAWLMRWLINADFRKVPLGAYTASSMLISAVLFASEHGPYWEVGLIAGLGYNWWMVRTKSLGDCILAHAVTNGLLSAYVVFMGEWQYW
jgi:CAAX prenyl protease-like protein